ncbi:MAG: glutamyl-tRNA reductase [Candidatus Bathyarchaeia archaeon]
MIVCLSVSHKKAGLPMLESVTFRNEGEVARALCKEGMLQECVVLQTCHRVEVYGVAQDSMKNGSVNRILRFWSSRVGVSYDVLSRVYEFYVGKEALAHLFSLAAGLESMVVGEDQILGQVRTAYVKAKKLGSVGHVLDRTFMKAVNTGRRVRSETKINEGSVSVSSAAVDLAARELGGLEHVRALVIGAGEAASIAADALRRRRAKEIVVANRSLAKGAALAAEVSGRVVGLDAVYDVLPSVDLVVAAVSVDKPIVEARRAKKALARNSGSRLLVVDISQPRAVEEAVGLLRGVVLRNIEDLKGIVEENVQKRRVEAEKARLLVAEELELFERELSWVLVEPLVSAIYRSLEAVRRREFDRAVRKMAESDVKKVMVVERFSMELVERIMQVPTEELKKAALESESELLSAAGRLFKVKGEEEHE